MSNNNHTPAVPSFESVEGLCAALQTKGQGADIDLYPRDGSRDLYAAEQQIAEITGNNAEHIVLQNNGTTAVRQAIDLAVEQTGKHDPVIAYSGELYAKSTQLLTRYAKRHKIKLIDFDSSSRDDIDYVFDKVQPDIFFSETVGNGPNVPVLDHQYLLERTREADNRPVTILDHTLPLTSGYDVFADLKEDDRAIVVESGTKAYALNAELAGITFVKNPAFLEALRELRCQEGSLPGVSSTAKILELLPKTKKEFDKRNLAVFRNTAALAFELFAAQHESGADFKVSHPSLATHANFGDDHVPNDGHVSPVLYIRATETHDPKILAKRLENFPGIAQHATFGQSFGFNETRILPEQRGPLVRIAGGAETNAQALGKLLSEAILFKQDSFTSSVSVPRQLTTV